jgi:hypothetical protein
MVNNRLKMKRFDLLNAIALERDNRGMGREPFLVKYSPPVRRGCNY